MHAYRILDRKQEGKGEHGSIDGWGAMLLVGRSRVGVPIKSLNFLNLPNHSSHTMALGFTQPLPEMSIKRSFWG
jgi:hypothetical protein